MRPPDGGRPDWVVQPLLDAGLDRDRVAGLLFRLAFDALVGEDAGRDPAELVADRPAEVQGAWTEVLGRLMVLGMVLDGGSGAGAPR